MQKVEGSSPFSRFEERPVSTAFPCLPPRSTRRAGRHFCWPVANLVAKTPRPESSAKASSSLAADGYIAQTFDSRRRYRATLRVAALGCQVIAHAELPRIAAPHVAELHNGRTFPPRSRSQDDAMVSRTSSTRWSSAWSRRRSTRSSTTCHRPRRRWFDRSWRPSRTPPIVTRLAWRQTLAPARVTRLPSRCRRCGRSSQRQGFVV